MTQRLFVTVLAGALGLLALVAAIHNHDVYYQLPKMRLIESSWGRRVRPGLLCGARRPDPAAGRLHRPGHGCRWLF